MKKLEKTEGNFDRLAEDTLKLIGDVEELQQNQKTHRNMFDDVMFCDDELTSPRKGTAKGVSANLKSVIDEQIQKELERWTESQRNTTIPYYMVRTQTQGQQTRTTQTRGRTTAAGQGDDGNGGNSGPSRRSVQGPSRPPQNPYSSIGGYGSLRGGNTPTPRRGGGGGGGGGSDDDGSDNNDDGDGDNGGNGGHGQMGDPHGNAFDIFRLRIAQPRAFNGTDKTRPTEWILHMCRWLRAHRAPEHLWGEVMMSSLEGSARSWLTHVELEASRGRRDLPYEWRDFRDELVARFESVSSVEEARRQLRRIRQYGQVEGYVGAFQTLVSRIPDVSREEQHSIFVEGLKPEIQGTVESLSEGDIDRAIYIAERLGRRQVNTQSSGRNDFSRGRIGYRGRGGRNSFRGHGSGRSFTTRDDNRSTQNHLNTVSENSRGRANGRNQKPRKIRCYLCDGEHGVKECPKLKDAKKSLN